MSKRNRRQDKAKKATVKAAAQTPGPRERREVITLNRAPAELDIAPETKWFLVYTGPRCEARASAGLEEAGCQTFWPSSHKVVTVGARTTFDGDIATFTRYLFASGPLLTGQGEARRFIVKGKSISSVFDIDGIQEIASNSRGWLRVPNRVIAAIADYQNEVAPEKPKLPQAKFTAGDQATIIDGPFMSFQATIIEAIGLHSAKVLIRSFGNQVPATMSISALQAA
jgi:hypothetical protein